MPRFRATRWGQSGVVIAERPSATAAAPRFSCPSASSRVHMVPAVTIGTSAGNAARKACAACTAGRFFVIVQGGC